MRITCRFGVKDALHPNGHTGIDVALREGTPIDSPMDGVVTSVVDYGKENIGKGVIVRFEDGTKGVFGHISESLVQEGDKLSKGDIVALSGNTGHSTGPHLHFGVKANGEYIDPAAQLAQMNFKESSWLDKFIENGTVGNVEFPSIGGFIYEKTLSAAIEGWAANFVVALPFTAIAAFSVWSVLNMVSGQLAKLGVAAVLIGGALICL